MCRSRTKDERIFHIFTWLKIFIWCSFNISMVNFKGTFFWHIRIERLCLCWSKIEKYKVSMLLSHPFSMSSASANYDRDLLLLNQQLSPSNLFGSFFEWERISFFPFSSFVYSTNLSTWQFCVWCCKKKKKNFRSFSRIISFWFICQTIFSPFFSPLRKFFNKKNFLSLSSRFWRVFFFFFFFSWVFDE